MLAAFIAACSSRVPVLSASTNHAQDKESSIVSEEQAEREDWEQPGLSRFGTHASSRFVAGFWGGVGISVGNPNDEDALVRSSAYLEPTTNRQFGRDIWIPANAIRHSSYPIFVPEDVAGEEVTGDSRIYGNRTATMQSWLFDLSLGDEQPIRRVTGEMTYQDTVIVDSPMPLTGIFRDASRDVVGFEPDYEALVAFLVEGGRSRRTFSFVPTTYPNSSLVLDQYESILIAGDGIADDTAALQAVHDWVVQGGRLWIMLDRTSQSTIERLLGNACRFERVDEVSVNQVDMELRNEPGKDVIESISKFHEEPLKWLRVLPEDNRNAVMMRGWPTLFWLELGRGKVMVTTLEARGWIETRPVSRRNGDPILGTDYIVNSVLRKVATDFFVSPSAKDEYQVDLSKYATSQVGYRVLPRWVLIGILGTFLVGMAVGGVYLARTDRMKWFVIACPLVSVGLAASLFAYGEANRSAIPSTLVVAQFVEVGPNADRFQIDGAATMYSAKLSDFNLTGEDGTVLAQRSESSNATIMNWSDLDRWTYPTRIGPGSTQFSYSRIENSSRPISANASFSDGQLVGSVTMPGVEEISDPILATTNGLSSGATDGATIKIDTVNQLEANQFFLSNVLTNEQQRRRGVYEELVGDSKSWNRFRQPTLFFWTPAWDSRVSGVEFERSIGWALVSIPIEIKPTPPGTRVALGTAWLGLTTRAKGGGLVSLYSTRQREWAESNKATKSVLAYRLPEQVNNLQLDRAIVEIEIRCSERPVRIYLLGESGEVTLREGTGAAGRMVFDIDDPASLQTNDENEFLIGIDVGEYVGEDETNDWQILDVQVELQGVTGTGD